MFSFGAEADFKDSSHKIGYVNQDGLSLPEKAYYLEDGANGKYKTIRAAYVAHVARQLQNAGIPAGCIHSAMSVEELREAYRDTRFGAYKILYIAPERLLTDGFCALAQELEISLLAVDEAHCISQWGQDFRPSYLKILDFLQKLPRRPALAAFTATATAQVRSDIVRILQLQDPVTVVTGVVVALPVTAGVAVAVALPSVGVPVQPATASISARSRARRPPPVSIPFVIMYSRHRCV